MYNSDFVFECFFFPLIKKDKRKKLGKILKFFFVCTQQNPLKIE